MNTRQDNAQESNAAAPEPTPQDPPKVARNGLAPHGPQETAEGQKLSRNGLTDFAPAVSRDGSVGGFHSTEG